MPRVIKSFFRSVVELLASESGELMSTRRKAHLLQHEMYDRVASQSKRDQRKTDR